MAVVFNTIEYGFPLMSGVNGAGANFTSQPIPIFIAETGRHHVSAILEVSFLENPSSTAFTALSAASLGLSLNNGTNFTTVSWSSMSWGTTNASNMATLSANVTAEFNARLGGPTAQSGLGVYRINLTSNARDQFTNVCGKLYITYGFETIVNTLRTKTVRLPIESRTSGLPDSLITLAVLPSLSGTLPENNKIFRNIFFENWSNVGNTNTTNYRLGLAVDADGPHYDAIHSGVRATVVDYHNIWHRTDLYDPTGVHTIQARVDKAGIPTFFGFGGWLTATYSYNEALSTGIMNSLFMGFPFMNAPVTPSGSITTLSLPFYIQEPEQIYLHNSAVFAQYYMTTTNTNLFVSCGNQPWRQYFFSNVPTRPGYFVQRIDAGSAQGTGIANYNRGYNQINLRLMQRALTPTVQFVNAIGIVNYISAKHPEGSHVHNRTIMWANYNDPLAIASPVYIYSTGLNINSNIYINNHMYDIQKLNRAGLDETFSVYTTGNNPVLSTFMNLPFFVMGNTSCCRGFYTANIYNRYPNNVFNNGITLNKPFYTIFPHHTTTEYARFNQWLTYHSIKYPTTGVLIDYAGDPTNIAVNIHNAKWDVQELVCLSNNVGYFSGLLYDNTDGYYATAQQSSTLVGSSITGNP